MRALAVLPIVVVAVLPIVVVALAVAYAGGQGGVVVEVPASARSLSSWCWLRPPSWSSGRRSSPPSCAAMTTAAPSRLGVLDALGAAVFLLGFGVEALADRQKALFRRDPESRA